MFNLTVVALLGLASSVVADFGLTPIALRAGSNPVSNIAGDGSSGSISLDWRDNGNAWGHSIFTVRVGNSVALVDGADRFTDQPHTGEDAISTVRFARGRYRERTTTFALVASREIVDGVPLPARTTVKVYVLVRNTEPIGTPYEFRQLSNRVAARRYCNADMALKTELGFPLRRKYEGLRTENGC